MKQGQQPEALRLADALAGNARLPWTREEAAEELRRQHTRIAELENELRQRDTHEAAIGAGGVEPLRPRRFDPGTLLEELGFILEERSGVWVVQEDAGGCHPANLTERVLWKALVEMHQPRQCLHQISEPAAPNAALYDPREVAFGNAQAAPAGFVPVASFDRLQALADSQAARILALEEAPATVAALAFDLEAVAEKMAIAVANNCGVAPNLAHPYIYLGLKGLLAAAPQPPAEAQEPVAHLWQHSETGRTRIVMPDQVVTADATWLVVGPLYLHPAPQQPAPADYSACASADSNYAAGMLLGWNLSVDGNEAEFSRIRESRMRAAVQASRTAAAATPQQPAPTESVLIDGIAYDTPAPVAAELLRLNIEAKQPAPAAQGDAWAALTRLADCCPELNERNYDQGDVEELNAWAVEVAQIVDAARAQTQQGGA